MDIVLRCCDLRDPADRLPDSRQAVAGPDHHRFRVAAGDRRGHEAGPAGDDFSLTNAALALTTLIVLDIGLSLLKDYFPKIGPWVDDVPLVIVEDGKPIEERLKKARVDEADVLESAREKQGIERMDQIKYVVLERTGSISIVPHQTS